jgi:integrase
MRWTERSFRKEVERVQRLAAAEKREKWIPVEDERQRNRGRVLLRVTPSGATHGYFRYSPSARERDTLPLCRYGVRGLSLDGLRMRGAKFSELLRDPLTRDIRAHRRDILERKLAQRAQAQRKREAERTAATAAELFTLRNLCAAYVADLERRGKPGSAVEAKGIFRRHVPAALGNMAARDVGARDVRAALLRLTEAGKHRAAGKLRSFMRAAYQSAVAGTSAALEEFKLEANPVAATAAVGAAGARDRVLRESELRALLLALGESEAHQVIHFDLLLGGQRLAQLLRTTTADIDLEAGTITLRDNKGRRKAPRLHVLPLVGDALALAERFVARAASLDTAYLFTTAGDVPLRLETLSVAVAELSRDLIRKEKSKEPFTLSDLRRTCETMLAALGVHRDVRAQLLSHGLGGVQERHYDRHTYANEKLAALTAWAARLRQVRAGAKILPIKGRAHKQARGK